ncbi:MAG: FkbM family methyltransferase [Candidatus Kapabacteria bacterium]|nr:FkbM family methyltransferase [Candidatus Kapabacteria bacterium]
MINKSKLHPIATDDLVRLGCIDADGGYVLPGAYARECKALLSLGLGDNWTFDLDVLKQNPSVKIIGVDHTISPWHYFGVVIRSGIKKQLYSILRNTAKRLLHSSRLEHALDYFRLFTQPREHLHLMVSGNEGKGRITIDSLMRLVDVNEPHAVLVKMDIEGSEYEVIEPIVAHADRIGVFVVEFHDVVERSREFNAAIELLLSQFHIFHIHGNNCSPYDHEADFPEVVEITFVNSALIEREPQPSVHRYPRPGLDVPNSPDKADYVLNFS